MGWVPTASGRLSFQNVTVWSQCIDFAGYSEDVRDPSKASESRRVVAKFHRRISNDTAFKAITRTIIPKFIRSAGAIIKLPTDAVDYFLVGKCNAEGDLLTGVVYILHDRRVRSEWKSTFQRAESKLFSSGTQDYSKLAQVHEDLEINVKGLLSAYNDAKTQTKDMPQICQCSFELNRNGECRILDTEILKCDEDKIKTRQLPETPKERADEAFRFIRDLFHKHYHHAESDDGVTEVHPLDGSGSWKNHVERILYQRVISARQKVNEEQAQNAKGILAYLRSFRIIYEGKSAFVTRNLETLEQSIDSISHSHSNEMQSKQIFWTALYIIPTTLLFAFMSIKSPKALKEDDGNNLSESQQFIFDQLNSIGGLGHALVAIVISCFYLQLSGAYNYKTLPIFREIKRFGILAYVTRSGLWSASIVPLLMTCIFIILGTWFILLGQDINPFDLIKTVFPESSPSKN